MLVLFAVVDASGNHTADTSRYVVRNGLSGAMAAYSLNLSSLSVTVPAGSRLAILFYFYDYAFGDVNHRIAYDNYSAGITNQITLNETILDTFPPTWSGGVSGIAAQDAGTDGVLQVSWNGATDPGLATTPPVLYDLYRVQSASCTGLWDSLNLYRSSLGSTSFQDTGLANGLTYCYGVRAKDSANPPNTTSNDAQTATATPSRGAGFGCDSCHASPPTSAGNAGSHAAHANNDADFTECNKCHPGTTSYTNSHQNGSGQLAFDGTAATAAYNGNQLSYTDNAQVIYNDTDGYGILTGSAGDGIDDGTCARHAGHLLSRLGDARLGRHGDLLPRATTAAGGPSPRSSRWPAAHITAPGGAGTCKDCHAGHFKGVRIPLPPASWSNPNLATTNMRTQLGIAYTDAGGIDLGGPGTVASINARTTEAEICWGCHDSVGDPRERVGLQHEDDPGRIPRHHLRDRGRQPGIRELRLDLHLRLLHHQDLRLDAGVLDVRVRLAPETARRVGAHGELRRRRAVLERGRQRPRERDRRADLPDPGAQGVDPLFVLPRRPRPEHVSGPQTGKPYLRGSWVGDPYPPELPPRGTYTYTTHVETATARRLGA